MIFPLLAQPKINLRACPRCLAGDVQVTHDAASCIQCGFVKYKGKRPDLTTARRAAEGAM